MPIALICFSALDIQVFYIQAKIMREFTLVPVEKRRNKTGNFLILVNERLPFPFFLHSKQRKKKGKTKTHQSRFAFITTP